MARLWSIVLVANLVGAFVFATLLSHTTLFDEKIHRAFTQIAMASMEPSLGRMADRDDGLAFAVR